MNCRKIWWNCKFSMGSWATARNFLQLLWRWYCVSGGLGDDSTLAGVMGCVLKTTLRYAMHVVMEAASCLCQGSGVMSLPTVCGTNSKGVLFSIEKIAESKLMLKHEEWKQAALVVRMKFQEARKKTMAQIQKTNPHIDYVFKEFTKFSPMGNAVLNFWMQIRMGTTHDKSTPAITNFKFCWCCICFAQWNCEHSMRLECEKCHVVPQSAVSGGPT
jgi:hypothetical protein